MGNLTVGQHIGLNAATTGIGMVSGLIGSAVQHKYNKQLAAYQNEMNIQNWNMQNEYNTPISQRNRLEDAGLNPALMYGNGAVSAGNAPQMHEYKQFGVDINTSMLQGAQLAQMAAQTRLTNAQAEEQEQKNPYVAQTADALLQNYLKDIEVKESNIKVNTKLLDKMDVEISQLNKMLQVMDADISLKKAQTKTEEERAKLTKAQEALTVLQAVTESHKPQLLDAQTQTAKAQGDLYKAENRLTSAKAIFEEWRNAMIEKTGADPTAPTENMIFGVLTKVLGINEADVNKKTAKEQAKEARIQQKAEHQQEVREQRHKNRMSRISRERDWYMKGERFEGLTGPDAID